MSMSACLPFCRFLSTRGVGTDRMRLYRACHGSCGFPRVIRGIKALRARACLPCIGGSIPICPDPWESRGITVPSPGIPLSQLL